MSGGDGTKDEIMAATYRALCTHGYTALSIEKIAAEFDKEKSVIYYHYDDKEDLLASFLAFMRDRVEEQLAAPDDDPEERLDHFLDLALATADEDIWEFRQALFEIQSDAPHTDVFPRQFTDIHDLLQDTLADILDDMDVPDSQEQAEYMFYCIEGVVATKIAQDDRASLADIRPRLKSFFIDDPS